MLSVEVPSLAGALVGHYMPFFLPIIFLRLRVISASDIIWPFGILCIPGLALRLYGTYFFFGEYLPGIGPLSGFGRGLGLGGFFLAATGLPMSSSC